MTIEIINSPSIPTNAAGDIISAKKTPTARWRYGWVNTKTVFPEPNAERLAELRQLAAQQASEEALTMVAQPGVCTTHDFELANMGDALEALRSGQIAPIQPMDDETLTAIEREQIGHEFSAQPYYW